MWPFWQLSRLKKIMADKFAEGNSKKMFLYCWKSGLWMLSPPEAGTRKVINTGKK
jgi:hypothetical protein